MDARDLAAFVESAPERIDALLDSLGRLRILVVGDAFVDEYLHGDAERVSAEAPVPVVLVRSETSALGGAANVVRNVVALGGQCAFSSVIGNDAAGERLEGLLAEIGVGTEGLVRSVERPTTRKTRVVARSQQVVRVDREVAKPLSDWEAARLFTAAGNALDDGVHGLVLEDYAKGVLRAEVARRLVRRAAEARVPVFVDPKSELDAYRGASLVKPNLAEAERLAGLSAERDGLDAVASRLRKTLAGGDLAITQGARGMTLYEGDGESVHVPTAKQEVFDNQGAGDTIIAALALARSAGADLLLAAVVANAAAGCVVQKSGTATASPAEVRGILPAVLDALAESGDGGGS